MPRALLAVWHEVPDSERAGAIAEWSARRARLEAAGCHYWVFESSVRRGRFLEFTEASDSAALRLARARAGLAEPDDDLYHEVELF